MKKLNLRKIRWILREMKKGEQSVYRIAQIQQVTPRWVRYLVERFKDTPLYKVRLKEPGRKPSPISKEEIEVIKLAKEKYGLGAVNLETFLKEKKIFIPHNRIHHVLKKLKLAKTQPNKSRRRKWIRWERRHSNSLWHTDWFEHKKKQYILYEDDASRFIVDYGVFSNATTDNSILVFDQAVKKYGKPKQVLSDHGTQFSSDDEKTFRFQEHLKSKGVELIKARVKHPQTNGKLERLVYTMKELLNRFNDLDKSVDFYNNIRPHMSLYNGHTRTPHRAFLDKKRKKNAKKQKRTKKRTLHKSTRGS